VINYQENGFFPYSGYYYYLKNKEEIYCVGISLNLIALLTSEFSQ